MRSPLYWKDPENRLKFFCKFAEKKGFDPYKPENWANVSKKDVVDNKVNHFIHLCLLYFILVLFFYSIPIYLYEMLNRAQDYLIGTVGH